MVDSMILAQWVVNLGRRDAKARIAHLLCEMAVRAGANLGAPVVKFDLPMTQSQFGDATGLTSVHVNRTLKALQAHGTTFRSGTVRIQDWPALVKVGDFDAGYLQSDIRPTDRVRIMQEAA